MLATRLNHRFDTYCSWKPDLVCPFVDAFSLIWPFNFCLSILQPDPTMPPENQQGQGNNYGPANHVPPFFSSIFTSLHGSWTQTRTSFNTQDIRNHTLCGENWSWMYALSQEFFCKIQHFEKCWQHPLGIMAIWHPETVQDLHWREAQGCGERKINVIH